MDLPIAIARPGSRGQWALVILLTNKYIGHGQI